ncbi:Type IV secretory pathway, VirB2 component (pilins) (plasmid) [Phaeobacter piscinae]|uniref:Type IV secretory pathway, VirB2 component (Pilins) n=1 Tax=Phaeobacter piscinae TaxID=1580596 RepID=A0ABM6PJW4_9RHOB|nr:Type IV secretory pathway, VirB2 component (pilins) [Phaeobacter piscinae]AUQ88603.1 Type IV secretory pathway, VirB2 component (pilins) [Phaeobacter piscinae]AUQ92592.1 Type IV secretory pathway, VirB2 component (pilins) [Phaeobacter inhibens]AUR26408.1 Type IV secretory pathway, VirB2 component (pilins) [Phaeobacter piscinae]
MQLKFNPKLAAMTVLTLMSATGASAQDLSPIQTMLETVESALTGPIGIAVATLAVIGTGFMCMMGRLNWGWFASVIVGIVLIFSAGTIVAGFA